MSFRSGRPQNLSGRVTAEEARLAEECGRLLTKNRRPLLEEQVGWLPALVEAVNGRHAAPLLLARDYGEKDGASLLSVCKDSDISRY